MNKNLDRASEFSRDYVLLTAEVDISRVSEKRRDPEIKLGAGAADAAAANLLKLAERINTSKTPAPSALIVLTGDGFSHRRPDGVFVVPLATLRA